MIHDEIDEGDLIGIDGRSFIACNIQRDGRMSLLDISSGITLTGRASINETGDLMIRLIDPSSALLRTHTFKMILGSRFKEAIG